ncbi:citrate lyase subunit beta / citryl-CoA lyase [Rhodococcoides kroppenstedtii]|uniref:Citrate lyase subunit beta / citryl-CoA lyase n=1 Tax=Rhodococcoides kroppenstedtii TaxID=293050 RepID=A0A1I0SQE1_9NOCA|nr:CoA ester lyase [Rhodococcus kroppenstedtii]SFA40986.1 citrate lyase subunit beta / citryl-CoA lyase [Rhodococcus kroppenstedtii]
MTLPSDRSVLLRRSVLAVPGSNPAMMSKARGLPADAVFLDLEDAVAPAAKVAARASVVEALRADDWGGQRRMVRVNDWTTAHTLRDLTDVVGPAGDRVEVIVLPKVRSAGEVQALDLILTQLERERDLPVGRIGIDAQIEDARGLLHVDAIAGASPRVEALVFGPGDFMADIGMRTLTVGAQPPGLAHGDAYHHVLMSILVAARSHGIAAVDGPWVQVRDAEGFAASARHAAALGYDGKWVLHPTQIEAANEIFAPRQDDFDRAVAIAEAYARHLSAEGGHRGAVMVGDEMVDEAGHRIARAVAAAGRAAGMSVTGEGTPDADRAQ